MKPKRRLWMLILGLVVLWVMCGGPEQVKQESSGPALLYDRLWVDRPFESPKTRGHAWYLVKSKGVGTVMVGSPYQHLVNVVRHEAKTNRKGETQLRLAFLQDDLRFKTKVKAEKCGKEAPKGFDLCLSVRLSGVKLKLYSSSAWKDGMAPGFAFMKERSNIEGFQSQGASTEQAPARLSDLGLPALGSLESSAELCQ